MCDYNAFREKKSRTIIKSDTPQNSNWSYKIEQTAGQSSFSARNHKNKKNQTERWVQIGIQRKIETENERQGRKKCVLF